MRLSASQRESLAKATDHYASHLPTVVVEYLRGRGFTEQVARTFRLGYVGDPLLGDEDYRGRLTIPYITPSGVIDIRYRALSDGGPKYMSRPGSTTHLFNVVDLLEPSDYIAICEGEMDTIVASGLCGIPAVGVPGANNWKDHFPLLFSDFRRVVVLCDGDQAGREFGKRVAKEIDGALVVTMPDGKDVNDVYLSEGQDGVRRRAGL